MIYFLQKEKKKQNKKNVNCQSLVHSWRQLPKGCFYIFIPSQAASRLALLAGPALCSQSKGHAIHKFTTRTIVVVVVAAAVQCIVQAESGKEVQPWGRWGCRQQYSSGWTVRRTMGRTPPPQWTKLLKCVHKWKWNKLDLPFLVLFFLSFLEKINHFRPRKLK